MPALPTNCPGRPPSTNRKDQALPSSDEGERQGSVARIVVPPGARTE